MLDFLFELLLAILEPFLEAILELMYPANNIDYGFRPDEIINALTKWYGDRDKAVNEVLDAIALNNARRRQAETRKNVEAT